MAPGAPLTAWAVPAITPPRPSPNHHTAHDHTIDAASAALTLGRQAIPSPSRIWIVAKEASVATEWLEMNWDAQVIEWANAVEQPDGGHPQRQRPPLVGRAPRPLRARRRLDLRRSNRLGSAAHRL